MEEIAALCEARTAAKRGLQKDQIDRTGEYQVRVIIRFSVDNEPNSVLRNKLSGYLTRAGFVRNANTATYENQHIGKADIATVLGKFWRGASSHTGPGRVDHFWMYSDRTSLDDIHPPAPPAED